MALSLAPFLFLPAWDGDWPSRSQGGQGTGNIPLDALMLGYYLLSLIGEQTARAGTVSQFVGSWLATAVTLVGSLVSYGYRRVDVCRHLTYAACFDDQEKKSTSQPTASSIFFLTGFSKFARFGVLKSLFRNFCSFSCGLVGIFLIFTLFELWRYIAATKSGVTLITNISSFCCLLLLSNHTSSELIAALSTYALMARRKRKHRVVGIRQSVYRLFAQEFYCNCSGIWNLVFAGIHIAMSNMRQDSLRSNSKTPVSRGWLRTLAGSGLRRLIPSVFTPSTISISPTPFILFQFFQFDDSGTHLSRILRAENAQWSEKATSISKMPRLFTF